MGDNPVPPPQSVPPPVSPELTRLEAEAHYTSLLAYFKHMVWLTGGALALIVGFGTYVFHSSLQDTLQDAEKKAAIAVSAKVDESVQKAFDEKSINARIEAAAKEKISTVTDRMIEQRVASELRPVERRMLALSRTSDAAARVRLGLRPGLDELTKIANSDPDAEVVANAKSRLAVVTDDYDTVWQRNVRRSAGKTASAGLLTYRFGSQPRTLHDVVQVISDDEDLNFVALAFLAFREMTSEKVRMFDFAAVKSWCANHRSQCQ